MKALAPTATRCLDWHVAANCDRLLECAYYVSYSVERESLVKVWASAFGCANAQ